VVLADINRSMLLRGRDRLPDVALCMLAQCDEALPLPPLRLRAIAPAAQRHPQERALAEMARVLRPGGRALVLEFSRVWKPLAALYDAYSFQVLPRLGQLLAGDAASYRYLAESIRMHPDQDTLKQMLEAAGFEQVDYLNLTAGGPAPRVCLNPDPSSCLIRPRCLPRSSPVCWTICCVGNRGCASACCRSPAAWPPSRPARPGSG
jgi:ubiquinone/menaquinone biosynthesis C-methylase UbiE